MPQSVRARKPRPTAKGKSDHTTADKAHPEQETNSPGREASGRFARGNPGGPGNPHARFSAQMLTIARQTMTPEKMTAVFEAIYIRALTGDMGAAKLLLHYTIGKPGDAPHPDHIERDEWDLYQKNGIAPDEMKQALGRMPCSLGNEIVGAALPAMTAARADELAAQLKDEEPGARNEKKMEKGRGMKDEANGRGHVPVSKSAQHHTATAVDPWDIDSAPPLTNGKTESAPANDSPATRYQPPTTDSFSPATCHQPPATSSSPLANRVSNGSAGGKKGRKLLAKQWLQPLAKKLTGGKQKSKKCKPARV